MKNFRLLIIIIIMLPLACKKEPVRVSEEPVAFRPQCIDDSWVIGQTFFGAKSLNSSANIPFPLVYNNKIYVFDAIQDEVRSYTGSGWDSIASAVPFANFQRPNFGFVIGNKGYLGNVDINQNTHPFYEYDFATNSWAGKANFPGVRRIATSTACFAVGSKGYVVGGLGEVNSLASTFRDTWAYNPANDSWTQKADVPLANRTAYATGFSANNKGYMVTGQYITETTTLSLRQLMEYDTLADAWTSKTAFPGVGRYNTAVFVINGTPYAGAGRRVATFYKDFYKYNVGSDTWTQVKDITVSNPTIFGFTLSGKGYVEVANTNSLPNFLMKYTPKNCIPPISPNM
jgi:hypothetical protein